MSETYAPASGGPFVQGSHKVNPKEVMFRIREENPKATRKRRIRMFVDEARADPELADACFVSAAINADKAWEKLRSGRNAKKKAERKTKAATAAAAVTKNILDFAMPNGKALRECTFAEVGRWGKQFGRIAAAGRPDQIVGEVLSARRAKALMRAAAS